MTGNDLIKFIKEFDLGNAFIWTGVARDSDGELSLGEEIIGQTAAKAVGGGPVKIVLIPESQVAAFREKASEAGATVEDVESITSN